MNKMNENKICLITCVNEVALYNKSQEYIKRLVVPEGFELQFIPITQAKSMAKAYNEAMDKSDAKYMIYLHQDTFIMYKLFLVEIINLFNKYPRIGMLGMIGAKKLPASGVWWKARVKYGKVYESHSGKMAPLIFKEVLKDYEVVKAVDGLIIATQYNMKWRADIFDGWHFYDISQAMEFINKGYQVVIPKQTEPWCTHDCGVVNVSNRYDHYREVLLHEYAKNIFIFGKFSLFLYRCINRIKLAFKKRMIN